ncbi:hypothetical protein KM043_015288 [Ampulex compressa]|nr:hypothetical protein KM043_015288 [Ampulex compressa]
MPVAARNGHELLEAAVYENLAFPTDERCPFRRNALRGYPGSEVEGVPLLPTSFENLLTIFLVYRILAGVEKDTPPPLPRARSHVEGGSAATEGTFYRELIAIEFSSDKSNLESRGSEKLNANRHTQVPHDRLLHTEDSSVISEIRMACPHSTPMHVGRSWFNGARKAASLLVLHVRPGNSFLANPTSGRRAIFRENNHSSDNRDDINGGMEARVKMLLGPADAGAVRHVKIAKLQQAPTLDISINQNNQLDETEVEEDACISTTIGFIKERKDVST